MSLMDTMATYITYEDVFKDTPMPLDLVAKYFSTFNRGLLIQPLAKLNIAIWKAKDDLSFQRDVARLFFSEEDYKKVLAVSANGKREGFIFHRKQLLLAIKVALLNAPEVGATPVDLRELGKILLSISSHLMHIHKESPLKLASLNATEVLADYTQLYYFYHSGVFMNDLSRTIYFWCNLPSEADGKALIDTLSFDPFATFQQIYGITIEQFLILSFMNLIQLYRLDVRTQKPEDYMLYPDFFSKTLIEKDLIQKMYLPITIKIKDFVGANERIIQDYLRGQDDFENNFLVFEENPLVELENGIKITVDPLYLQKRIFEAPYYLLLNYFATIGEYDVGKGRELSKFFGGLIELYMGQVLKSIFDIVVKIPENDGKTPDYLCINMNPEVSLAIVEVKKLGVSKNLLFTGKKEEILKLVKGTNANFQKGFSQIYTFINNLKNGNYSALGIDNSTLDIAIKAKTIYPLLITDQILPEHPTLRKLLEDEVLNVLTKDLSDAVYSIRNPKFLPLEVFDVLECFSQDYDIFQLFDEHDRTYSRRIDKVDYTLEGISVGYFNLPVDVVPIWEFLYKKFGGFGKNLRLKAVFDEKVQNYTKLMFGKDMNNEGIENEIQ